MFLAMWDQHISKVSPAVVDNLSAWLSVNFKEIMGYPDVT